MQGCQTKDIGDNTIDGIRCCCGDAQHVDSWDNKRKAFSVSYESASRQYVLTEKATLVQLSRRTDDELDRSASVLQDGSGSFMSLFRFESTISAYLKSLALDNLENLLFNNGVLVLGEGDGFSETRYFIEHAQATHVTSLDVDLQNTIKRIRAFIRMEDDVKSRITLVRDNILDYEPPTGTQFKLIFASGVIRIELWEDRLDAVWDKLYSMMADGGLVTGDPFIAINAPNNLTDFRKKFEFVEVDGEEAALVRKVVATAARLAPTTQPVTATSIPTSTRTAAQESELVTFVARVIREQNRTRAGDIVVGDTLLHVVLDAQGRYWLKGLGMPRVINPKNIIPAGTDLLSPEKVQVKLPMSDYTRMLGEADRSVNEFFEDLPESITQTKVVEIFDLNILPQEAFGPNLTYLLRRYILEKKQDPNFVVLFGGDSWKIEQAMAEVYDLPVDVQKLFISKPADLPQPYKDDIDNVRVISMDGFKDGKVITAKLPIIGKTPARHFIVKVLDKNDIMHPAVHRAARLAARVPELTPERKGYFERLVRVYETLLGHKIGNIAAFIKALKGDEIPNLSHYVVLPLLQLDNALRLLSQAARMAEQSA